jgi:RNA polymerase sigma-70 factor (ECF subfamily)
MMTPSTTSGVRGRVRSASRPTPSEAEAFEALFERSHRAIFRFARSRVGPDLADEIVADTFATAWRIRHRIAASMAKPESWLFGIASKVIVQHARAEARWLDMCAQTAIQSTDATESTDDEATIGDRLEAQLGASALAAALAKVPRREREPFLLHVLGELPYEEIAEVLNIPIGTVRSRISRSRARLSKQLASRGLLA